MGKEVTLTEADLTAVKVANDALTDLHILRLIVCRKHYWTDADFEKFSEKLHDIAAGLQVAKLWIATRPGLNGNRKARSE